ncbi:MAG: ribose-5-phosphate isomerase RpiA [Bacteroidota bacterium]
MSESKKIAGEYAASLVESGMKVGLGTGSTAYFMVLKLGERVQNEGLNIVGIPTSKQTEQLAKDVGIPLTNFFDTPRLDICIDGADEFDPNLQLIKGGGGALLREKLVASIADQLIIIADERKQVDTLGAFPLPVEVNKFGWELTFRRFKDLGYEPELRMEGEKALLTDNHNFIFDCKMGSISEPASLHQKLKAMLGVVETGLFIDMADKVILAKKDGKLEFIERKQA